MEWTGRIIQTAPRHSSGSTKLIGRSHYWQDMATTLVWSCTVFCVCAHKCWIQYCWPVHYTIRNGWAYTRSSADLTNLESRVEAPVLHVRLLRSKSSSTGGCIPWSYHLFVRFPPKQAWERWTKDGKHGLNENERDQLLYLLRDCALAPSPVDDANKPRTYYHDKAIENLKQSSVWRSNAQVRSWLQNKWLSIPEVIH